MAVLYRQSDIAILVCLLIRTRRLFYSSGNDLSSEEEYNDDHFYGSNGWYGTSIYMDSYLSALGAMAMVKLNAIMVAIS